MLKYKIQAESSSLLTNGPESNIANCDSPGNFWRYPQLHRRQPRDHNPFIITEGGSVLQHKVQAVRVREAIPAFAGMTPDGMGKREV